ncbi:MAG: MazG family protein [Clostridiales bacterium]|nr:MazG family protein [Clostridiales bacterium]
MLKQLSLKNNNLTEDINNLLKEPFPDESTIDAFAKFCRIVRILRAPNGCPWDRAQTHESLKTCLIEEAYEVVEAIQRFSDTNDAANLKEELGDVLLQVILHGQIASEEGIFELKDIIDEISKKMIRRHPHVFGTKAVDDASQVVINWEEIKRQEKKENGLQYENELEMIPKAFPALIRAQKVLKKSEIAKNSSIEQLCIAAKEKITKLQCDNNQKDLDIEEIIGTLLLDVTNLAMQYNKNSEQLLAQSVQKLIDKSKES